MCRDGLPDIRKRRRLSSSLNVLDGLKDVTAQLGYGALLPSDREDGDPPSTSSECHLCCECFSQLEKMKEDLAQLASNIGKKLQATASSLGLQPSEVLIHVTCINVATEVVIV